MVAELRRRGVAADTDYAGRSLKGQLTQAGRLGATTIVVVGPESAMLRATAQSDERLALDELVERLPAVSWRDLMCGELRPEHVGRGPDARRLGRTAPRPRRPRLRRPARPHRRLPARDQPRARARGGREPRTSCATSSSLRAEGEVVRARAGDRQPEPADRRGRAPGRRGSRSCRARLPLPFQLDEESVDETLRLRYRWLDLRREQLQRNIALRAQMVGDHPARDGGGRLPRHPDADPLQADARGRARLRRAEPPAARAASSRCRSRRRSYKQLLVIAGFDRYYQIAICFRDEDLRADRVQEITQLDVEMAFPDQEVLFALMERMFAAVWRECIGVELETPFPRMTYAEADRRFGSDKPDLRFGLEIEDATEADARLGVRRVRERRRGALPPRAAGVLARRARSASRSSRRSGAPRGSPTSSATSDGEVRSPIAKFLSEAELAALAPEPGRRRCSSPPTRWPMTSRVLGALRLHLGQRARPDRRGRLARSSG